jgi:hypothetical protein
MLVHRAFGEGTNCFLHAGQRTRSLSSLTKSMGAIEWPRAVQTVSTNRAVSSSRVGIPRWPFFTTRREILNLPERPIAAYFPVQRNSTFNAIWTPGYWPQQRRQNIANSAEMIKRSKKKAQSIWLGEGLGSSRLTR